MMRRGITLLELMVVLLCMAIILGASTTMVATAIQHTNHAKESRVAYTREALFEDRLRSILENAYLSSEATDTASYFRGGTDLSQSTAGQAQDPSDLVFTALSPRIPSEVIASNDDFETLNDTYGPEGGLTEYELGLTPIGDSPGDSATGLYLRHQTPADGDYTQGGYQTVLDPDIESISYEFYNGTDWETTWDTQADNTPRLPSAIRITYRRTNDNADHTFVVRLIHSDVTPENPVTTGDTNQ
ncbi:MAG: prepilin-type N-terminal cleavage/methylation domain-containing protein [Armatimonadetes bacterium]|nr:prepilin-type N-terminal cleavage/methylation domain-containing protein [Armatimonadota bacterium]